MYLLCYIFYCEMYLPQVNVTRVKTALVFDQFPGRDIFIPIRFFFDSVWWTVCALHMIIDKDYYYIVHQYPGHDKLEHV